MLAACSGSKNNPYRDIADPPLTHATLHTVTLVTGNPDLAANLVNLGYTELKLPSNYPAAVRVEAGLWDAPEELPRRPAHHGDPRTGRYHHRTGADRGELSVRRAAPCRDS